MKIKKILRFNKYIKKNTRKILKTNKGNKCKIETIYLILMVKSLFVFEKLYTVNHENKINLLLF